MRDEENKLYSEDPVSNFGRAIMIVTIYKNKSIVIFLFFFFI